MYDGKTQIRESRSCFRNVYAEDLALLKAATIPGAMTRPHLNGSAVVKKLTVTPGSALTSCVTLDEDLTFLNCNRRRPHFTHRVRKASVWEELTRVLGAQ